MLAESYNLKYGVKTYIKRSFKIFYHILRNRIYHKIQEIFIKYILNIMNYVINNRYKMMKMMNNKNKQK